MNKTQSFLFGICLFVIELQYFANHYGEQILHLIQSKIQPSKCYPGTMGIWPCNQMPIDEHHHNRCAAFGWVAAAGPLVNCFRKIVTKVITILNKPVNTIIIEINLHFDSLTWIQHEQFPLRMSPARFRVAFALLRIMFSTHTRYHYNLCYKKKRTFLINIVQVNIQSNPDCALFKYLRKKIFFNNFIQFVARISMMIYKEFFRVA